MLICASKAHGNTAAVAHAIAEVLGARVVTPGEAQAIELGDYDLIGFGSGVYYLNLDAQLRDLIETLPRGEKSARAFIFATSGMPEPPFRRYLRRCQWAVEHRGYTVVGTFACRGYDDWGIAKAVGGIGKHRPSSADLTKAREFARQLQAAR